MLRPGLPFFFVLTIATGCGGAQRPAAPEEEKEPSTAQPELPCPPVEQAIIELLGEVPEGNELATRQCELVDPPPNATFFVVGSIGQPEDSQSEEGWSLVRFLADDQGKVVAAGPTSGAGWMTGVSVGKLQMVDLDGDGRREVLELMDQFFDDPNHPTSTLTVYRRRDGKLADELLVILKHLDEGADEPYEAPPLCKATFEVNDGGISVTAKQPALEAEQQDEEFDRFDPSEEPEVITRGYEIGEVQCLAPGSYRFEFNASGVVGKRTR